MVRHKIAYVSRLIYPDPAANALQTMQMAAAFADRSGDAHLFVHDLAAPEEQVRQHYALDGSALQIWPLHARDWPVFLYHNAKTRFLIYNSALGIILAVHPAWRRTSGERQILFVRSRLESAYWGLMRPYFPRFRKWTFIYEAHDIAGLRPQAALEENPFDLRDGFEGRRRQRQLRAMKGFDLILCVTQALTDDLKRWSNGALQPHVIRHASGLPRLRKPPVLPPIGDKVVLGYTGTIDRKRGVDVLIRAMLHLPEGYVLRLVGRIKGQMAGGRRPGWMNELLSQPDIGEKVELVQQVAAGQVADEIDRCHIMLQPSSDEIISFRYRAPLKLFDYMVRGKPIVAAGVSCHLELLQDGSSARIYRPGDPEDLAACVKSLVEQPRQAEAIARTAWKQSVDYTYDVRARRILELVDAALELRQTNEAVQA